MGFFLLDEIISTSSTHVDAHVNWSNADGKIILGVTWRDCRGSTNAIVGKEVSAHRLCNQDFWLLSESTVQRKFLFNNFSFGTKILTVNNAQVFSEVDNWLDLAPDLKTLSKYWNIEMNTRAARERETGLEIEVLPPGCIKTEEKQKNK